MKKQIVMLLVFVMLFAFAAAVIADDETASPVTLNWVSVSKAVRQAGVAGGFYEISDFGMDVWVPDVLTPQEDIPEDSYYVFADESGTAYVRVHRIGFDNGEITLGDIEEAITEMGSVSDGIFWINGYDALIYETKETDSAAVVIPFDDGDIIEFIFSPMSNSDFYSLASLIMSTIQPHVLHVEDVAGMIKADLNSVWGELNRVNYTDDEDGASITIYLWEEGVNSETIQNVNNWDAVREDKINTYNSYVDVLNELGFGENVLLTLMYISPEEELSFLTISGGEITYDIAD